MTLDEEKGEVTYTETAVSYTAPTAALVFTTPALVTYTPPAHVVFQSEYKFSITSWLASCPEMDWSLSSHVCFHPMRSTPSSLERTKESMLRTRSSSIFNPWWWTKCAMASATSCSTRSNSSLENWRREQFRSRTLYHWKVGRRPRLGPHEENGGQLHTDGIFIVTFTEREPDRPDELRSGHEPATTRECDRRHPRSVRLSLLPGI